MSDNLRYKYQEIILDDDTLQKLLEQWKETLGLQNWTINIKVVRGYEIPGKMGECQWMLTKRLASIKVIDPTDYTSDYMVPYDMEHTLVHELMHIVLGPLASDDDKNDVTLELTVDQMAHALVAAKRLIA